MTPPKVKDATNPKPPVSTPKPAGHQDNWMIMELGEMRGDIKVLTQSIDHVCETLQRLERSIERLDGSIESTRAKVARLDKIIFAAAAVVTVVVGVGGYFADKAIDFGLDMAKQAQSNYQAPQAQPPQAQATPIQNQTAAPLSSQKQK